MEGITPETGNNTGNNLVIQQKKGACCEIILTMEGITPETDKTGKKKTSS
jgi:hypothetical protein